MGEISSESEGSFYGSQVRLSERDMAAGTVSFGGVSISATDAAQFVMMHRTEVLKQAGVDRTELAQQHLADIREARDITRELTDSKAWGKAHGGKHERCPISKRAVEFFKDKVGSDPEIDGWNQMTIDNNTAGSQLPDGVKADLSGWSNLFDEDGNWIAGKLGFSPVNNCLPDNIDNNKENINNYIDQLNSDNNLFMTKFKAVINTMNEALEGANSMSDKTHDTLKSLLSRW